MPKKRRRLSTKAGLPPGTIIHIGEERSGPTEFQVFTFNEHAFEEHVPATIEECSALATSGKVTWINVTGVHESDVLTRAGELFHIHPLALEDISNTEQRPKTEEYDGQTFVVLKMLSYDEREHIINSEQVSIVLAHGLIITFQERHGDVFDPIRERLRAHKGRIRKMGSDYLCYALIDLIVDNYYYILETIGERIEDIQEAIAENPDRKSLLSVQELKKELIYLRKSVWPLRELVARLEKMDSGIITKSTTLYFRDVYDHTIELIDTLESLRDVSSSLVDIYLSSISNRQNVVMKTLTLIATIFMPLTFIAGVYGMNFHVIPELSLPYGYPAVLILMAIIAGAMLIYFKKNGWFR